VLRVCHTVHVLDFGQVIASGTPDEIRRDPVVQEAYLGHATEAAEALEIAEAGEAVTVQADGSVQTDGAS
jgi:branched-chain amino acid transport system ATP-binding protein